MAIAQVGTFASISSGAAGTAPTLGYTTVNAGDLILCTSSTTLATSVQTAASGGGSVNWRQAVSVSGGSQATGVAIFYGSVSTVGAVTLTATLSASANSSLDVFQFTAGFGPGTRWSVITTAGAQAAASTTMTFPTMNATDAGQLWYGYTVPTNVGSVGSTAGFTYQLNNSTWTNIIAYRLTAGVGAVTAPTATQSTSAVYNAEGLIITALPPMPGPQPYTARARASNY